MEGLTYTSSLGKTTKDRCYELVEIILVTKNTTKNAIEYAVRKYNVLRYNR